MLENGSEKKTRERMIDLHPALLFFMGSLYFLIAFGQASKIWRDFPGIERVWLLLFFAPFFLVNLIVVFLLGVTASKKEPQTSREKLVAVFTYALTVGSLIVTLIGDMFFEFPFGNGVGLALSQAAVAGYWIAFGATSWYLRWQKKTSNETVYLPYD